MKPTTRSFYELAVQKAIEHIVCNLDQALDLHALARAAALSPFHFHRVFRGAVDETPLEMQRRLRMERAAWSLRNGDVPVTSIAFAAGYETHESFTRAFRLHYACSPSEFRQSRQSASAVDGGAADGGAADGGTADAGTADGSARSKKACGQVFKIELAARSGVHFLEPGSGLPNVRFIQGARSMHVTIKEMSEFRVASLRHVGPYQRISEAFARLGEIAGRAGLLTAAEAMLAIYYDDPETTPASELRSDAALAVSEQARVPQALNEQRVPGGRYASTLHVGPYEQLGDVWARFMGEWLPQSGERMGDGVSYEIYRNTPADVPPEKLETELYIPLAQTADT